MRYRLQHIATFTDMQAQAPSLIPRTKYTIGEVGSRTQCKIVFIFRFGHKKSRCKICLTFSPSPAIKIAKLQGRVVTEQLCWYFKQSMGTRNRVGIGLSYRPDRLHRLVELVSWNQFPGLHKSLKIRFLLFYDEADSNQYSQRKKLREKRRAGWVFIFIWWPFRVMIDILYLIEPTEFSTFMFL
jgi:hypothetical protein